MGVKMLLAAVVANGVMANNGFEINKVLLEVAETKVTLITTVISLQTLVP